MPAGSMHRTRRSRSQCRLLNVVSIGGGYRVRQNDLDACLEKAAPDATVVALPDRTLGHRLAGAARDKKTVAAALDAQGANALISGAFRQRGTLTSRSFRSSLTGH